jgi:hypothetical protein
MKITKQMPCGHQAIIEEKEIIQLKIEMIKKNKDLAR